MSLIIECPMNHMYEMFSDDTFPIEADSRALFDSMGETNRSRVLCYDDTCLSYEFAGCLFHYKDLAENLPKDFTVIDIGANQAAQGWYFKEFLKYIAVEPDIPETAMPEQRNAEHYMMTGQTFIEDVLPTLDLDMSKTIAICSNVPDESLRQMISETFRYYRCTYWCTPTLEILPMCDTSSKKEVKI